MSHHQQGKRWRIRRPLEYFPLRWLWIQLTTFPDLLVTAVAANVRSNLDTALNPVTATDGTKFARLLCKNYTNLTGEISASKTEDESVEIQIWLYYLLTRAFSLSLSLTRTHARTQGKVVVYAMKAYSGVAV
jgi:hypothetical protein